METQESTTQNLQSSFAIVCQTLVAAALQDRCLLQLCLLVLHLHWDPLAHSAHRHQWLAHLQFVHPQSENHLLNFATLHPHDVVQCFMFVKKMNLSKVLKKWSKLKMKLRVKRHVSQTNQISISVMPSKFSTQDDVAGSLPLILEMDSVQLDFIRLMMKSSCGLQGTMLTETDVLQAVNLKQLSLLKTAIMRQWWFDDLQTIDHLSTSVTTASVQWQPMSIVVYGELISDLKPKQSRFANACEQCHTSMSMKPLIL